MRSYTYRLFYYWTKRKFSVEGSLKADVEISNDDCREMRNSAEMSEKRQLLTWKTNKQLKKAHQTLEELKRTVSLKVCLTIPQNFCLKLIFHLFFFFFILMK